MEVVHGYRDLPRPLVRAAIAIGNFDGVHVGHAALIAAARAATDGDVGVLTFEPHPAQVLAPHAAPARLTTPARKLELLAAAGVDVVVTESSLTHRSVKEMEHELGPSAQIRPSADVGGVRIASLAPGSIARAAGLQEGDVVTAVNGYPLASPSDLLMAYASALEAQSAVIELRRGPRAVVLRLRIRA